jgi:hypothetical protein
MVEKEEIMIDRVLLFGFVSSIVVLILILELIRRRRLKEEYSLLWLGAAVMVLALSLARPVLDFLADVMETTYPPNALFLIIFISMLFLLLQFATAISRLSRENKEIAQQVALLRWEVVQLRQQHNVKSPNGDRSKVRSA